MPADIHEQTCFLSIPEQEFVLPQSTDPTVRLTRYIWLIEQLASPPGGREHADLHRWLADGPVGRHVPEVGAWRESAAIESKSSHDVGDVGWRVPPVGRGEGTAMTTGHRDREKDRLVAGIAGALEAVHLVHLDVLRSGPAGTAVTAQPSCTDSRACPVPARPVLHSERPSSFNAKMAQQVASA